MYAILFITLSWSVLALVFVGMGLGLQRAMGFRQPSAASLLATIPLGYAGTIAFLQIIHLFMPVTTHAFLPVAVFAVGCLWRFEPEVMAWVRPRLTRRHAIFLLLLAGLTLWLADRALGPGQTYDSGLYHWNVILWSNARPVVPGLGNLHERLAFNNSSLLLAAMLNTGVWSGMAGHLANGFATWMVWLYAAWGLVELCRRRASPLSMAMAGLVLPAILMTVGDLAAPDTDVPLAALTFLGMIGLIGLLLGEADRDVHLAHALVFLATAVCLKLSAIFFLAGALPVMIWRVRTMHGGLPGGRRSLLAPAAFAGVLLLGWAIHGVMLSGYPFFPSTALAMPVEWRIPAAMARQTSHAITSFARYHRGEPSLAFDRWDWVLSLYRTLPWGTTIYLLESVPLLFLLGWISTPRDKRPAAGWAVVLCIPTLVALAAWFLFAPDLRFGWHLFWLAPLGMLALVGDTPRGRWVAAAWAVPVILAGVVNTSGWWSIAVRPLGPDRGFYPVPKTAGTHLVPLSPRVAISVADDGLIWAYPAPSTSQLNRQMRLRNPANLGQGFCADTGSAPP